MRDVSQFKLTQLLHHNIERHVKKFMQIHQSQGARAIFRIKNQVFLTKYGDFFMTLNLDLFR